MVNEDIKQQYRSQNSYVSCTKLCKKLSECNSSKLLYSQSHKSYLETAKVLVFWMTFLNKKILIASVLSLAKNKGNLFSICLHRT